MAQAAPDQLSRIKVFTETLLKKRNVSLREFLGPDGLTKWKAWIVEPTKRPFTSPPLERRVSDAPEVLAERRSGQPDTRRSEPIGSWVCFESVDEKRRLTPAPDDWEKCSDRAVLRYLEQAVQVKRYLQQNAEQP